MSEAISGKILDKEMDLTRDLDLMEGDDGVGYFMTDVNDLPREFFKKYVAKRKFLDIGSGDGRIVMHAFTSGADAYGIDYNRNFVKHSALVRRIKFGDFLNVDYSKYTALFYALRSNVDADLDFELIKKFHNFEGILITYYRKTPYRVEIVEKALFEMGFKKIDSIPHASVYERVAKEVEPNERN